MNDEYLYLWAEWGALQKREHYESTLKCFSNLTEAWRQVTPDFFLKLGIKPEKVKWLFEIRGKLDFQDMTETMRRKDIRLIHLEDAEYPAQLKEIATAPPFLFVRGKLPSWHKTIAVVGTRKMTGYGRVITEKFVADLVRNGFVIVSGLASGVDAKAHEVALKHHGTTVAVLGSGADKLTPYSNERLGEQIIRQGGAIISEFPIGTDGQPHHFPQRNRIIAGLSQGVLVTEGGENSGALITAERGLEEGRDIFAIPYGLDRADLSGTNYLIQQGAFLVQSVQDILDTYEMNGIHFRQVVELTDIEKEILSFVKNGGKTIDELCVETPYDVSELSDVLVRLCLKGQVQEAGLKWILL